MAETKIPMHDVQRFEPHPRERVRPEPMAVIEVDCAVVSQVLEGGILVNEGYNKVEVYESDIPKIIKMVLDPGPEIDGTVATLPERVETAKARYVQERDAFLEKSRASNPSVTWNDVAHEYRGPKNWVEQYYRLYYNSTDGPAIGIPPLRRVTVLARALPPPMSENEKRAQAMSQGQAELIATAVAKAMQQVNAAPEADTSTSTERKQRRGPGSSKG